MEALADGRGSESGECGRRGSQLAVILARAKRGVGMLRGPFSKNSRGHNFGNPWAEKGESTNVPGVY
jgi:hypothetical protein